MIWQVPSRSRSRMSMDWRPGSRSRSRPATMGRYEHEEAHSHALLEESEELAEKQRRQSQLSYPSREGSRTREGMMIASANAESSTANSSVSAGIPIPQSSSGSSAHSTSHIRHAAALRASQFDEFEDGMEDHSGPATPFDSHHSPLPPFDFPNQFPNRHHYVHSGFGGPSFLAASLPNHLAPFPAADPSGHGRAPGLSGPRLKSREDTSSSLTKPSTLANENQKPAFPRFVRKTSFDHTVSRAGAVGEGSGRHQINGRPAPPDSSLVSLASSFVLILLNTFFIRGSVEPDLLLMPNLFSVRAHLL